MGNEGKGGEVRCPHICLATSNTVSSHVWISIYLERHKMSKWEDVSNVAVMFTVCPLWVYLLSNWWVNFFFMFDHDLRNTFAMQQNMENVHHLLNFLSSRSLYFWGMMMLSCIQRIPFRWIVYFHGMVQYSDIYNIKLSLMTIYI